MLFLTKQFSFIVYSICLIVAVLCMLQPFVGNHTTVRKALTGTGDCNHIHIGENPCWRRLKRFFVSYQKVCDKFLNCKYSIWHLPSFIYFIYLYTVFV